LSSDTNTGMPPIPAKQQFRHAFVVPEGRLTVQAEWVDAYFLAADRLTANALSKEGSAAYEVVSLYLYRHYLELALKRIIFHSRFFIDNQTNATYDTVEALKCTHSLQRLWEVVQSECKAKVPADVWHQLDISFIAKCIQEIHAVDPNGEMFRYHGPKFGFDEDPASLPLLMQRSYLSVDCEALRTNMRHVYGVMNYLDAFMLKTYIDTFVRTHHDTPSSVLSRLAAKGDKE
jgi:hypothetical protein